MKALVQPAWKGRHRRRASRGVLARHVPPIPHEAIGARAARLGEAIVEHRAQLARFGREPIDDHERSAQNLSHTYDSSTTGNPPTREGSRDAARPPIAS